MRRLRRARAPFFAIILAGVLASADTGRAQQPPSQPSASGSGSQGSPPMMQLAATGTRVAAGGRAQQPPSQPSTTGTAPPAAPPVIQFASGGISLQEAVRITLQNDPAIRLAEADVALKKGLWQEQTGAFDATLLGNAAFSHQISELSSSEVAQQQQMRDSLQSAVSAGPGNVSLAQQAVNLVTGIQNGTVTPNQLTATSPALAASLIELDALIGAVPPAQAAALTNTRNQLLTTALQNANQNLANQQQTLSQSQQSLQDLGPTPRDQTETDITMNVQLNKLFRNGITVSPYADGTYDVVNFRGKPQATEFGGMGLTDLYTFHAGVNGVLPLARGRGRDAVAGPERSAELNHDASQMLLEHQRPQSVLNTVLAYWGLRAAQDTADIQAQSLQFQQQLVQVTRARITAGDLAGFELARAQAAEARNQGDLADAQRSLKDARVALAIAMGVAATADDATLPGASDDFPQSPQTAGLTPPIDQALQRRQDLSAAAKLEEAGQVLATSARINTRPQVDLDLGTFFTALNGGSAANALSRWVGPSGSFGLQITKPLGNNALLGQLAEQEASVRVQQINRTDLARQIRLNVIQGTTTLQESVRRVEQAQSAVGFYQSTIDAEVARLRTGDATVIDTITTQQQQVAALLGLVSARLELAQRIIQLRFDSATLVTGGIVRPQDLITIPDVAR
jgi:outer membrane protein TolC